MLAVIFDMDGLMFDTEQLDLIAWKEAGKKLGWPITNEILYEHIGVNSILSRKLMQSHFGPEFDFDVISNERLDWLHKWISEHNMPVKQGLQELLDWLDQHAIKRAVATSSNRSLVNFYRAHIDPALGHSFDGFNAIVTGEQIQRGKPEPDIFLEVARQLDISPRNCVVLEDSYNGIKAAHAANMMPIMVPDLLPPTPEILKLVYSCVENLTCVIPVLEKLIEEQAHDCQ